MIRQRARQRGLPFTITLVEFREFCQRTGYIENKGTTAESLSIDRIDHDKGYHHWNICVKSFQENSESGHTVPGRETMQNERKPTTFE